MGAVWCSGTCTCLVAETKTRRETAFKLYILLYRIAFVKFVSDLHRNQGQNGSPGLHHDAPWCTRHSHRRFTVTREALHYPKVCSHAAYGNTCRTRVRISISNSRAKGLELWKKLAATLVLQSCIRISQASSNIIKHHQTSSNIIIHHQTSSYIIKHHHTSSNIIKHHHTSSNIIKHHQTSSNIIRHHQTISNIIKPYQTNDMVQQDIFWYSTRSSMFVNSPKEAQSGHHGTLIQVNGKWRSVEIVTRHQHVFVVFETAQYACWLCCACKRKRRCVTGGKDVDLILA